MKKESVAGTVKSYQFSILLIVLVPLLLYISALKLGFVYMDDDLLVLENYGKISHFSNIGQAFRTDAFFASVSPFYRPLMSVSFMIDAALGGKSPVMYHLGNVICHILTCVSLLWLLSLMGFSQAKALTGALLFAVHPMMGHAVLWIPARGDLLVTLFTLLSFGLLILYNRKGRILHLTFHLLCFAFAIFSKESAAFLPIIFLGWLLIDTPKLNTRKLLICASAWLLIMAVWYALRLVAIDQRSDSQVGMTSLMQNIAFLPEVVMRFFFPFMLPVTPVFSTVVTFFGILLMLLILLFLVWQRKGYSLWMVLFGAAWFVGFCLPNMIVRLDTSGDSFDYLLHRTYLPYIGLLIVLLSAIPETWIQLKANVRGAILSGLMVILSTASFLQIENYTDARSYWGSAIEYAPDRAWFHYYLGRYYAKQKDYPNCIACLRSADSLRPNPEFKYNLGVAILNGTKDYEKAYQYFTTAFSQGFDTKVARADFVSLCVESSNEFFRQGSYAKAVERCEEAFESDPANASIAYNLGIYLVNAGEKKRAAAMWRKAVLLDPTLTKAYSSLILYYQHDVICPDSVAWYSAALKKHSGS